MKDIVEFENCKTEKLVQSIIYRNYKKSFILYYNTVHSDIQRDRLFYPWTWIRGVEYTKSQSMELPYCHNDICWNNTPLGWKDSSSINIPEKGNVEEWLNVEIYIGQKKLLIIYLIMQIENQWYFQKSSDDVCDNIKNITYSDVHWIILTSNVQYIYSHRR